MNNTATSTARSARRKESDRFETRLATHESGDVLRSQRLRYKVFAEEMGANLHCTIPGVDQDVFDLFCEHLIVVDKKIDEVIATTRVISSDSAFIAGKFYSETEFDLSQLALHERKVLEIGRTCVHPMYRSTPAINYLWQGVARAIVENKPDYLIGCVSVPLDEDQNYINSLTRYLESRHMSLESLRVTPKVPLPKKHDHKPVEVVVPSLLRRYLNIGAKICGQPAYDADFNVADYFILIDVKNMNKRYERHFLYGA